MFKKLQKLKNITNSVNKGKDYVLIEKTYYLLPCIRNLRININILKEKDDDDYILEYFFLIKKNLENNLFCVL